MTNSAHEKARDEVRAMQERAAAQWRQHPDSSIDGEVPGFTRSGAEKPQPLELHTADGRVHLNSHGEIGLDQDGVIRFRKLLDQAFQAVA